MKTENTTARDGFVRGSRSHNIPARRSLILVLVLGLAAVATLVQFGENGIFAFFHLQNREAQLRQEVAELETSSSELSVRIKAIADDPAALEKLAREKHNMKRPGEEVLVVRPATERD